jgi:hypothetical protein
MTVRRGEGLTIEIVDTVTGQPSSTLSGQVLQSSLAPTANTSRSDRIPGSVPDLWRISDHGSESARIQAAQSAYAVAFNADETQLITFSRPKTVPEPRRQGTSERSATPGGTRGSISRPRPRP